MSKPESQRSILQMLHSALFGYRSENTHEQASKLTLTTLLRYPQLLQRPHTDDRDEWSVYWQAQNQPWRTEPEISTEHQHELEQRLASILDVREEEILYFKDIHLNRADIKWLLATHKKTDKVVIITRDNEQRQRHESLTLSGADLRNENLSGLPMERVNLLGAHLEGAKLRGTHLEESILRKAHLEGADLTGVHLEGAYLGEAHLEGVPIFKAHLENAILNSTHLEKANLQYSHLTSAYLEGAHLEGADLRGAHLEGARLIKAHLEGADIEYAHLEGADLMEANLAGVRCCRTFFDVATRMNDITISDEQHGSASIGDVGWNGVNLTVVDWSSVKMLGYERQAHQKETPDGKIKTNTRRLFEYKQAVRSNRQLAVVLRDQGLNEEADHFEYRAQVMQRKVLWHQRDFGHWFFSLLLAVLSGYGYRIWHILASYIVLVSLFAIAYFVLGMYYPPHLHLDQAYLESITAFHGRVFLEQFSTNTPQIWLTAFEAITGLVVEGVFIAMLIQRFFGK